MSTLPLAPIGAVREADLPRVIERMQERLRRPAERGLAPELWSATFVLLGMRYSEEVARVLLQGVREMRESVTYQAILREGEAKGRVEGRVEGLAEGSIQEARRMLLRIGRAKLGRPDLAARRAIQAITEVERLEQLSERVLAVNSWQELLAPSTPRRRNGRRGASQ